MSDQIGVFAVVLAFVLFFTIVKRNNPRVEPPEQQTLCRIVSKREDSFQAGLDVKVYQYFVTFEKIPYGIQMEMQVGYRREYHSLNVGDEGVLHHRGDMYLKFVKNDAE